MAQLLAYLAQPEEKHWRNRAAALCMAVISSAKSNADKEASEETLRRLLRRPNLPDLAPPTDPVLDPARYHAEIVGDTILAVVFPVVGIQKWRPESIRCVCRLEDYQEARQKENYRNDWRRFLLIDNLLQFLPRYTAVTTEHAHHFPEYDLPEPRVEPKPSIVETNDVLADFAEIDDELQKLVLECAKRKLPLPEVEPELTGSLNEVAIELAWTERKIALLHRLQLVFKSQLEQDGWIVLSAQEAQENPDRLWTILGNQKE